MTAPFFDLRSFCRLTAAIVRGVAARVEATGDDRGRLALLRAEFGLISHGHPVHEPEVIACMAEREG